ncbi:hypothetical protein [Streptomyces sp. NPDC050738]|uniref:hypothetical protein n=1 Tax=Streptomyces sp. NPDC050738 TaxID=3154744 RepID=UPI0034306EB7
MPDSMNALQAALRKSVSSSWAQRARAGRDLAAFAEVPLAEEALARLLLDASDTAVTRQTAEALARVGTVAAIRLIALAVAQADDNQGDWLQTGVQDAVLAPDSAPDVAAVCAQLAQDPDANVRRGAARISSWR